jgi:LPS sulfotransferase NodH
LINRVLSYLVCATPRSGTTLLCELLKDTGVAGRPEEYFEARSDTGVPPHPGDYLDDLPRTGAGIRDNTAPPTAPEHSSLVGLEHYRDHLARTFALGTTPNGVFGAKLMWRQLAELQRLAGSLSDYEGLDGAQLLARLFDRPRYVWVTRTDKIRQAVSLWRALQTRSWRFEQQTEVRTSAQLHYRYEGIDHLVGSLRAEDADWQQFFEAHQLPVLKVSYEELDRDRDGTVRTVLHHLGVQAPSGWRAAEVTRRQADVLSEQWVAAYHRDAAQRMPQLRRAAM